MSLLQKYLKLLTEGYKQSTIRRTRQNKINSSTGTIAVSMAREKNDSLYRRMIMYKKLYIMAKKQLERKYRSKSTQRARKLASGTRK